MTSCATHKPVGPAGKDSPEGTEEVVRRPHQATLHHLSQALVKQEVSQMRYPSTRMVRRKIQRIIGLLSDLGAREVYATDHSECNHAACTEQPED